ncbi:hypothetical protein B7463_g2741, partial [Scytalidium lignicola]
MIRNKPVFAQLVLRIAVAPAGPGRMEFRSRNRRGAAGVAITAVEAVVKAITAAKAGATTLPPPEAGKEEGVHTILFPFLELNWQSKLRLDNHLSWYYW